MDRRVHIIMDLKCPDSGECERNRWANLDHLKPTDEIKFVLASRRDFDWAAEAIRTHRLAERFTVLFSAVFGPVTPRPRGLAAGRPAVRPDAAPDAQVHLGPEGPRSLTPFESTRWPPSSSANTSATGTCFRACAWSAAPATTRPERTFTYIPGWVWVLFLVNLIVLIVIALVLMKRMTVRVPVCDEHRSHWSKRTFAVLGTLLAVVAISIGAFAYFVNQQPPNDGGWICLGTFGLLFVWLVAAGIIQSTAVRTTHITNEYIQLTKVHPDFVDALREERARIREEGGGRRRDRYGDVRDDYDDGFADDREDEPRPRRRRPRADRDEDDRYDDERPARRPRD